MSNKAIFTILAVLFLVGNAAAIGSQPCCLCGQTYPNCVAPDSANLDLETDLNMGSTYETCGELQKSLHDFNGGFPGGCEAHAAKYAHFCGCGGSGSTAGTASIAATPTNAYRGKGMTMGMNRKFAFKRKDFL